VRVAALVVWAAGCDEPQGKPPAPVAKPTASVRHVVPPPEPLPALEASGDVPFDFPVVGMSAEPRSFVIAPSRAWLEEARERGVENQTFIYHGARLLRPGPEASELETRAGKREVMPNAMIVPIAREQKANPGDVVLTTWASGSGMQRAIVVAGGSPDAPAVRYLDIAYDAPSGWGRKSDTLPPNTFERLREPGAVGTTVACLVAGKATRFVVTKQAEGKLLLLGFAGRMRALSAAACSPLPIVPDVKPGDAVWVPVLDVFIEGRVTRVERDIGRIWASHAAAGGEATTAFAFTNVAIQDPAGGPAKPKP
jgi:hypothetical protein